MAPETIHDMLYDQSTGVDMASLRMTPENEKKNRNEILANLNFLRNDFKNKAGTTERLPSEKPEDVLHKMRSTYFSSILMYLEIILRQGLLRDPEVMHTAELFLGAYRGRRFGKDQFVEPEDVENANETLDMVIGDLELQDIVQ